MKHLLLLSCFVIKWISASAERRSRGNRSPKATNRSVSCTKRRSRGDRSPKATNRSLSRDRSAVRFRNGVRGEEELHSSQNMGVLARAIELSEAFPVKVRTETYTAKHLLSIGYKREEVRNGFTSFRALIHEDALSIAVTFLKMESRSETVASDQIIAFMSRLIRKRAVYFYGANDRALIVVRENGKLNAYKQSGEWETIGTLAERAPFTKENCLTYDELRLSALISFSGETIFLNDGNRNNNCRYEQDRSKIEPFGVIIGAVGPRFEKPNAMEYRDMVFLKDGEEPSDVDRIFSASYEQNASADCKVALYRVNKKKWEKSTGYATNADYTINSALAPKGSSVVGHFDQCAYAERLRFVFDTALVDANNRARQNGNLSAFVHFVGLGLGVWAFFAEQSEMYTSFLLHRIETLSNRLTNISDIRLAHINAPKYKNISKINQINIVFSKEEPSARVGDGLAKQGKLLVTIFAYDGNAFAGNEFWNNAFSASGDPAAACSSQIAETFNPHINARVGARNLYVVRRNGEMLRISDYLKAEKKR